MADAEFILKVLDLFSRYDSQDSVSWRTDGEFAPVTFFVNCSDLFWWATADAEDITPENFGVLEQAFIDCQAADKVVGTVYAPSLFAARVRKLRPQRAAYPKDEPFMWPLFDACGPERDRKDEG